MSFTTPPLGLPRPAKAGKRTIDVKELIGNWVRGAYTDQPLIACTRLAVWTINRGGQKQARAGGPGGRGARSNRPGGAGGRGGGTTTSGVAHHGGGSACICFGRSIDDDYRACSSRARSTPDQSVKDNFHLKVRPGGTVRVPRPRAAR